MYLQRGCTEPDRKTQLYLQPCQGVDGEAPEDYFFSFARDRSGKKGHVNINFLH